MKIIFPQPFSWFKNIWILFAVNHDILKNCACSDGIDEYVISKLLSQIFVKDTSLDGGICYSIKESTSCKFDIKEEVCSSLYFQSPSFSSFTNLIFESLFCFFLFFKYILWIFEMMWLFLGYFFFLLAHYKSIFACKKYSLWQMLPTAAIERV